MTQSAKISKVLFAAIAILFSTSIFAGENTLAADKMDVIESTATYTTPAVKKAEAQKDKNSLIFFLDKAEYFTISIMNSEGEMIVNTEVKGNAGLNDFSLASIPSGSNYTYTIVGETTTSKRGILQGI